MFIHGVSQLHDPLGTPSTANFASSFEFPTFLCEAIIVENH